MNELTLSTALETALNRIEDMLASDDGQAFKEARKFLPVGLAALAALRSMPAEPVAKIAPYGYCPQCGAKGVMRERSPTGNTTCENGHHYKSSSALATPHTEAVDRSEKIPLLIPSNPGKLPTEAVRMSEAEIDDLPLPKEPDYDDKIKFARAVEQATAARLGVTTKGELCK